MYNELNGKVALVTGASRGFGRAIALRLAKEGCSVVINYRKSKSEAESVMYEIDNIGGTSIAVRADMGKEEKIFGLFEVIKSEFGKIDIVIANASFGIPGKIMDATSKHWNFTMASTAESMMHLAQYAAPIMPSGGRILSITSYGGQRVLEDYGVVGPAKSAVEGLTRTLAVELAPKGISVNGIMPGVADTKSFRAINNAEKTLNEVRKRTPTGTLVTPEQVANVTAFMCSNQSEMINGQFIVVDGGTLIVG